MFKLELDQKQSLTHYLNLKLNDGIFGENQDDLEEEEVIFINVFDDDEEEEEEDVDLDCALIENL